MRMRLREVPKVPTESRLRVNTPGDYAYAQPSAAFFQTTVYVASAAKLAEFYALLRLGASATAVLTSIPWAFFFLGALFLRIFYDSRGSVYGRLDLVAGQLPADPNPGGARIVVLGASRDPRTQLGWRFFWGTGAVVTAASVVGTYISLSDAPRNTIFIWAAFQILWLLLRTLVHYTLPIALDPSRPIFRYSIGPGERLQGNAYEDLPPMVKARVTNLALAVGQAQTLSHRRGRHHYFADSFSLATVPLVQKHRAVDDLCPLPNDVPRTVSMKLAITAVVGDTALCSSLWLLGHSPPPLAVPYYSCVVIFSIPDQPLFAIPSARVLSVTPLRDLGRGAGGDAESASFAAAQHTWWYWIPANDGRWLEFRLDGRSSLISGKESVRFVDAIVRSDADLDAFLQLGTLNSSGMRNVAEAREAAKISRMGRDGLLELFGSGI
ncbi:hypothetical protein MKEN_00541100 [Mycena kentingensis (nom. inval.)]|nr:hypothetical protein MKEN_00541100 [Mycena kentingensis (nom. inval.)]